MINRRQMLVGAAAGAAGLMLSEANALAGKGALVDSETPVLGNPRGNVTVVEFFDYQCAYCKWSYPKLKQVIEQDGNVRLVMKDLPVFGASSVRAATLVLAASETGQYKQALGAMMATHSRLQDSHIDDVLAKAGLNPDVLHDAARRHSDRIERILARNKGQARAYGLRGTPSFVIGSRVYSGVQSEWALNRAIAAARGA